MGKKKKSIVETHPHLVEEWDYEKNDLKPEDVTLGSIKKIWWACSKKHSWQATPNSRTSKKTGCPYCSGRLPTKENNLLVVHPTLIKEWDYSKNKNGPECYLPKSNKKVWWVCEKNHSWEARISERSHRHSNCPYCGGKRTSDENNVASCYPGLINEWDFNKNKKGPECYTKSSNKKVWWVCEKNHSWKAKVVSRTVQRKKCPYCSGRFPTPENNLFCVPRLIEEWDYKKNISLKPENVTPASSKKVWWKCKKNHSWKAKVGNRYKGCGCPYCAGRKICDDNNFAFNFPNLIKEWDFDKNKKGPEHYTKCSGKKVWWKCECGHQYGTTIAHKAEGTSCPKCSNKISKRETAWLDSLGINIRNIRINIGKKYINVDGYNPETNTVYEFYGDYWHGNPKVFDINKKNPTIKKIYGQLYKEVQERNKLIKEAGYNLVYIWEYDYDRSFSGCDCTGDGGKSSSEKD